MKQIVEAAKEIQDFLENLNWKFCFIGGLAVQRWGRPRLTNDVDLTLLTGFGNESEFLRALLQKYQSRRADPVDFALRNRILLLQTSNNIGIDISLGALFFEEHAVARASYFEYLPGIELKTCSAEDLIVLKAFADRLQDWADIENVIIKQKQLDWDYINTELPPLTEAKYEPEIVHKLEKLRRQISK